VVWTAQEAYASPLGVYGKLFQRQTNKLGNEFRINAFTPNDQKSPAVAPAGNAGYVVTWTSYNQDTSLDGIYGRRYAPGGGNP
jgi:hypothetical protein